MDIFLLNYLLSEVIGCWKQIFIVSFLCPFLYTNTVAWILMGSNSTFATI